MTLNLTFFQKRPLLATIYVIRTPEIRNLINEGENLMLSMISFLKFHAFSDDDIPVFENIDFENDVYRICCVGNQVIMRAANKRIKFADAD